MLRISKSEGICISCCDKNKTNVKRVSIDRKDKDKGNIASFTLCSDCIRELAREFQEFE